MLRPDPDGEVELFGIPFARFCRKWRKFGKNAFLKTLEILVFIGFQGGTKLDLLGGNKQKENTLLSDERKEKYNEENDDW